MIKTQNGSRTMQRSFRANAAVLAVGLMAACGRAGAFEFDPGNQDLAIRWDNELRYNYAYRLRKPDQAILNSPNYDDGDRNFDKGTVSNRLDLLSQFDVSYRRMLGFRASGAGWYDQAYVNLRDNDLASSNNIVNGAPALGLSGDTKRYFKGPSGELLDAFVFGNFDIFGTAVNLKAGKHEVYWGESVLSPIHGINYGQSSLDYGKAVAVPGTEAQELFRPRNAISAQVQALPSLSLAAQYFLTWNEVHIPEAGSYLGFYDFALDGGESLFAGPGQRLLRGSDVLPHDMGDYGVAARWSPQFLDGTLGFYYRNTSDILPQVEVTPAAATLPSTTCTALHDTPLGPNTCYINPAAATPAQLKMGEVGTYNFMFPAKITIYGLSFTKNIAGVSVGMDLGYRHNMSLNSSTVTLLPAPLAAQSPGAITATPARGETGGARGDTAHAVVNFAGLIPKTPLFDSSSYVVEFVWNQYEKVIQGEAVFTGRPGYTGVDAASKNFYGVALNYTPTWFQVLPGADLLLPISFSSGLKGNSAVQLGGNEGTGSFSGGLGLDVHQKYRFDVRYTGFYGELATNSAGQITSNAGALALLRDRGNVGFTFKTTF